MMAGNFQQMGNAGGNSMMMQQQAQGPNSSHVQMQMLLLQQIRANSQPPVGWQATVAEQERLRYTFELVTQLRLATNPASQDLTKICRMGLDFEKQAYDSAPDKDTYVKLITGKLGQLTSARTMGAQQMAQQQQQQQQMGIANQAGGMGQPFQQAMQQLNMQHLQQQMQPSPMQGQQQPQQIPMGMGNNIMGQNIPPNAQFQMNMQQQQQQVQMQAQQGGQPRPHAPLTQTEQQLCLQLAKQMMAQTSEQEKQNLRARAQASMTPEQWDRSQASHVDPVQQYFQTQAIKRLRMQRAAQMAQRQSGQGMSMGMNRQPGAIPMQQQRSGNPNPMVPQPQQGQQLGIPGNPDFPFLDQQQQNQNPQDGNQLSMQSSLSQQGNTTPQNMAGLPAQSVTPNQQRIGQNPQMIRQQQFNAQQQAQVQAQAQEKVRRAQMAALQGQPGGLGGMPPSQSPAMNTLNAPLAGTPQQNVGGQGPAVSQPGPSQFGQPIDPRFAGMTRPGVNGQMPFPNGMSAEQRQKFSQLPPDKLNEMITKWHQQRAMQDQANGLAGGMPGGGQMMQNPGGPQPQPGQQGMANPMNQFMPNGGQPMQRPPPQMPPGMTPQQQALLRQQMQQRQMQQAAAPQPQGPGAEQSGGLDNLEFPPGIYTIIPRQLIPQGITKWGQLKQWIVAHGANAGLDVGVVMEKASQLQRSQMQQLLQRRALQQQNQQRAAAGLPPLPPQQPGQPGQMAMTPQMAQQLAQMQQMQGPITPQDVENARNHNSGRWLSLNDEQIRQQLMMQRRNQHMALLQRQQQQQMQQQQQQQQNQQFNQQQIGMPQMPQMPGQNMPNGMMRPNGAPSQQGQPGVPAQMKRPQPNQHGVPQKPLAAPPMEQKQTTQQRAAKPTQPTSSPAQAPNSKKRASSDDVVEVPNPNAQVNRPQMPPAQPGMQRPPSFVQPTPEQLAAMPPDKKQKYMQFIMQQRQRQMAAMGPQPTPADMQEFSRIRTDESANWKPSPPLQMSPEERTQVLQSLQQAGRINQVFNIAPKWFTMKKDEQRLRAFFRAHLSINDQFEDGAKMQRPKAALSMKASEVGQAMAIANSMVQDVAAKHPEMMKARQAGQQPPNAAGPSQQGQQQQSGPAPAPLNAANLQQQQQALSQAQKEQQKSQMQRASMSNNKAPPAPTTTHATNLASGGAQPGKAQSTAQHASPANQPQFAVNSPQGVPAMYGPKAIDQGQLRLPPNKRKKTDGGMASGGNTPTQGSKPALGQQNQNGGQPMMKTESQQEAKVQTNGQQAEQAQPQVAKQQGFVCTDRDCEGQLAPFPTEEALEAHNQEQHKKPMADAIPFLMDVMGDFLGLDEQQKAEATAPEVKRDTKPSPSQKSKEVKPQQDPWAASGVNPQELMAVFKPFETGASGAISNVDAYRSISPNDTPESMESDKTHPSDPNSDITEGTALDITMQFEGDKNWDPFGEADMDAFTIGEPPKEIDTDSRPIGQRGDKEMVYNELPGSEAPEDNLGWDDMVQWEDPDQPFSFDSSLFEMDDGSSMF